MSNQYVTYQVADGIAVVTIDRPPVNALNPKVLEEITNVFEKLRNDQRIKVVILTGAGEKAFVAGADIGDLPGMTPEKGEEYSLSAQKVYHEIIGNFEKVVICALNGMAVGGGCELALGCDIRVAAENVTFSQPEVGIGLIPGGGGTQVLPRLIPPGKAKQMIFTGELVSAREAKELGLVEEVVPRGKALEKASEIAQKIATKAPLAVQAAKKAINEGVNLPLKDGLVREAKYWGMLCGTQDQKEGARAFLEKRKPSFQGK